jgi:DNA (cytosine-5)-methyltransferase 1
MKRPTVNDFFCGAGGMGLGFKEAGFEIVGAWDWMDLQVEHYRKNVGDHVKKMDINEMTWEDVPAANCWTYGFPCQDLSRAGKMDGLLEGKRSGLFFQVMRLLDETAENNPEAMPDIIMAENVEDLRQYLPVLEEEYKKRGYRCHFKLFNSKFWDVAQNRKRFFVVGIRDTIDAEFDFPEQKEEITVTLRDILEKDPDESLFLDFADDYKNLIHRLPAPADFLLVKQATKKGFIRAYPGDSINIAFPTSTTRRGRRGEQVAQTLLTGKEQVVVLDDLRVRFFTVRETARLQGFPDSYEFIGTAAEAQELMGNAVTVNVAKAIAIELKKLIREDVLVNV